jgi:hypothetical protein
MWWLREMPQHLYLGRARPRQGEGVASERGRTVGAEVAEGGGGALRRSCGPIPKYARERTTPSSTVTLGESSASAPRGKAPDRAALEDSADRAAMGEARRERGKREENLADGAAGRREGWRPTRNGSRRLAQPTTGGRWSQRRLAEGGRERGKIKLS